MTPAKSPYPFLGTWRLTSCETSHPNLPHPKSSVTTFAEQKDGIQYRADTTWSDGRTTTAHGVFAIDGGWSAVTGSAIADSVSLRILDDGSIEGRLKKHDRETGRSETTVSADRTTMHTLWEVTVPGGVAITWNTTSIRQ